MNVYVQKILRISMGLMLLWAFFDKLFGLGYATPWGKAWINGVSPTFGFLKFATHGPFAFIFRIMAGSSLVEYLFMGGLLLIGLAFVLGIKVKIAGYSGALMMFLMWLSLFPPENNPVIDEHIIFLLVFLFFATQASDENMPKWLKKLRFIF